MITNNHNFIFFNIIFDSDLSNISFLVLVIFNLLSNTICETNLIVQLNREIGLYYGSGTDVCINKKNELIFEAEYDNLDFISKVANYYHGTWFWFRFYVYSHLSDKKVYYPYEEGIWLVNKFSYPQIFHFLDNFISLHYFYNYSLVPPINTLLAPSYYPLSDYDYSYLNYKFLIHQYKPKLKEVIGYDFAKLFRKLKTDLICFHNINFIFRVRFGFYGCFFKNYNERIKFRDSVFDYLRIKSDYGKSENNIEIAFIQRNKSKNSRNIVNSEIITNYLRTFDYNLRIIIFEEYNPVEQIRMFQNYNIIFSAMGSGLLNMLWLGSNVVIIECFNYFYIHSDLSYQAISYGFSHISLFSTKRLYPKEHYAFVEGCYDTPYTFSNTKMFLLGCDAFHNMVFDDMYINLREIVFSVEYGNKYLEYNNKL